MSGPWDNVRISATTVASPGNVSGHITANGSGLRYDYNNTSAWDPTKFEDRLIQGECLAVEHTVSSLDYTILTNEKVKEILLKKLVDYMMDHGNIEFTKQEKYDEQAYVCRARIFVVPNSDVQLLRTLKKIK